MNGPHFRNMLGDPTCGQSRLLAGDMVEAIEDTACRRCLWKLVSDASLTLAHTLQRLQSLDHDDAHRMLVAPIAKPGAKT